MDIKDVLSIFLIFGVITFTLCIALISYFLIQALKAVTSLAEHLKETTEGLKEKVGLKALAAVPPILVTLISKLIRRK